MGDSGGYCEDCYNALFLATTNAHAVNVLNAIVSLSHAYATQASRDVVDRFEGNLVVWDTESMRGDYFSSWKNNAHSPALRFEYNDVEGSHAILSWFYNNGDHERDFDSIDKRYCVLAREIQIAILDSTKRVVSQGG